MGVMLDKKGLIIAFLMGATILILSNKEYLALILVFLIISVMATRYGAKEKKELGIYEYERSWENVLSNGIFPTIFAVMHPVLGPLPFITSVAAITADKFGSELGVLGKKNPIFLLTLKEIKTGTSGAVSVLGTVMSFAGALIIASAAIFIFGIPPSLALIVGVGGFAGCVVDTIAGVLEEKGIGNKSTSNLLCAFSGGIFGSYIAGLIH